MSFKIFDEEGFEFGEVDINTEEAVLEFVENDLEGVMSGDYSDYRHLSVEVSPGVRTRYLICVDWDPTIAVEIDEET